MEKTTLEKRIKENMDKPFSLEDIKRMSCEVGSEVTELKLKKNLCYLKLNKDGYEIYFHKRNSDGMWYVVKNDW